MGLHDEAKLDAKFREFGRQMNLYLNHFPKHEKYGLAQEIRRKAYECYGLIVEAQKRYHKKTTLTNLDIAHEQLRMFIHPAQRGLNFVGYRTWRTRRYIRKHSLFKFGRAVRESNLAPITSILGHARNTCSLKHLVLTVKENNHDLYRLLPKVYRRSDHQRAGIA